MDTTLIAKVLAPKTNGCDSVGTAYPISKDWVLTARHVVEFNDSDKGVRDTAKPISIVWEQIPDPNDSQKPYKVKVNQSDIEFFQDKNGEILDVALIKCQAPPQAHILPLLLSERHPVTNEQWESRGYALLGRDDKGKWLHEPAGGEVLSPDTSIPMLKLTSKADAKNKNDWQGISGAPVFAGRALIAVLTDTPTDRGECFIAVSIPYLLCNVARFRELTGVGQCDYTFKLAIKTLLENPDAQAVLCNQINLNQNPETKIANDSKKIIDHLAALHIPELIRTIRKAQKDHPEQRKILARLLCEMLPSLYDPACAATIRSAKGDPVVGLIQIPHTTEISAEMLMANVDNRQAYFQSIPISSDNIRKKASPKNYKLPLPPESGLGTQQQHEDISNDLYNRLLGGHTTTARIATAVDGLLYEKIFGDKARDPKQQKLLVQDALELEAQEGKSGYYWILTLPDEDNYKDKVLQLAKDIKVDYPYTTLLSLTDNFDREREEMIKLFYFLPDTLDE